jgi:hypothetical protein
MPLRGDVGGCEQDLAMGEIIIGSEAVASGAVTRHELQRWYRPMFPNVHVPKARPVTLRDRTVGAWLWSKRGGIVSGVAASALHGAAWVDDDVPVELIWSQRRHPPGIITRNETLDDDEVTRRVGLPVTTPARTAFDLGRHLERTEALARLDALMRASPFSIEDAMLLAKRYRGARGLRQLRELLPLVDGGGASPQESRLRLLFIDAGFPKPTTQVPIVVGRGKVVCVADMGWEEFMVLVQYDGDQHRTNRKVYVKDVRVMRKLARLDVIVIRVIKEDRDEDIIERAWTAMVSRGWKPQGR